MGFPHFSGFCFPPPSIGHSRISFTFYSFQCFSLFVTAGIIYNRKIHSFHTGLIQRLNNLWNIMCSRHQIDIGGTFFLQFQKNFT